MAARRTGWRSLRLALALMAAPTLAMAQGQPSVFDTGVVPQNQSAAPASGPSVFDTGAAPLGAGPAPGGMGPRGNVSAGPTMRPGGDPNGCMAEFMPIREEAERRAGLIAAASKRKAQPDEACKLIRSFSQQEAKLVNFLKAKGASCGVPPEAHKQAAAAHSRTVTMETRICRVAAQGPQQAGPVAPSLSEAIGTAKVPELNTVKKGPGTFDTLTGNALVR